ncbi:hypothetical protein TSTA_042160 [Talaromyces stipitatus ATCC 10500]|uniref:Uncharacterized protein n=1 Tax=Talaromyces stipitatus (strain ATCC 10500 / CBS 375.48 / QM 6759 / NRRL 1006) TaxID=441959 RepID=B8MJS4_TALSN|nr:uncharacterized protein TSTA_042160 [Talaromyces stipitatus ATCC 10500]EED14741.1 hypothetical protein TSTA_042160 [Talaromyces stipitatus ATCC 10500]
MITKRLGQREMPVVICTDSYSLYECLTKLGTTKEKRLMIDLMALRQSYERREIDEIRWIHGDDNPADAFTKSNPNKALQDLVEYNKVTIRVEVFLMLVLVDDRFCWLLRAIEMPGTGMQQGEVTYGLHVTSSSKDYIDRVRASLRQIDTTEHRTQESPIEIDSSASYEVFEEFRTLAATWTSRQIRLFTEHVNIPSNKAVDQAAKEGAS